MKKTIGITKEYDLDWVKDHIDDIEFQYEGNLYQFSDGLFYIMSDEINEEDNEFELVENMLTISDLYIVLMENSTVVEKMKEDFEATLLELGEREYFTDYIKEIKC